MDRIDLSADRLDGRWAVRRRFERARRAGFALGWLAVLGCGQAGLVEPDVPVQPSRLLEAPISGRVHAEVLHASVEVFGLEIANLESTKCVSARGGAILETEVEPAALLEAIRSTGGAAKTEIHPAGVVPRSSEYTFRDGDIIRHYQVDYRAGGYVYVYDNGGVERRTGDRPIPEGAEPHDMQSSLLLLRAWRPRLDERAYFYVVLGRRPWRVDVTSRGPEMIKLADDPRLTYRIDGVAVRLDEGPEGASKHFSLWLSEGAERVPVRMVADASFGQVTMTLTAHESGGERACALPAVARAPGSAHSGSRRAVPAAGAGGVIGSAWRTPHPPDE